MNRVYYGIHEASGQDITFTEEVAYSVVTGGGKPGQGYPAVFIKENDEEDGSNWN